MLEVKRGYNFVHKQIRHGKSQKPTLAGAGPPGAGTDRGQSPFTKRALDLLGAVLLLIFLAPLLAVIAVAIRVSRKAPLSAGRIASVCSVAGFISCGFGRLFLLKISRTGRLRLLPAIPVLAKFYTFPALANCPYF